MSPCRCPQRNTGPQGKLGAPQGRAADAELGRDRVRGQGRRGRRPGLSAQRLKAPNRSSGTLQLVRRRATRAGRSCSGRRRARAGSTRPPCGLRPAMSPMRGRTSSSTAPEPARFDRLVAGRNPCPLSFARPPRCRRVPPRPRRGSTCRWRFRGSPADVPHSVHQRRAPPRTAPARASGTSRMPWSAVTSKPAPAASSAGSTERTAESTSSRAAVHCGDCQPNLCAAWSSSATYT